METVTKVLALVEARDTTEESPNGAFEVVLSAPTLDRDGEVIDSLAFDPLPDHIPFDVDHGMTVASTIGSGRPFYAEDGTLRVAGSFASTALAQEVRSLVSEGHIRTTSVTFMAAQREEKDGTPHVVKAELLNGTFTPVPSNREAVVLSAKAMDAKAGARNSAADAERMQQIHDLAVSNGAMCEGKSHTPELPADEAEEKTTEPEPTAETVTDAAEAAPVTADAADEKRTAEARIRENEALSQFGR